MDPNETRMNSKLIPSNPSSVTVIRHVSPNIVTCSAPFLRFGLIKIGGRGTIVRMRSGALAVFSPTALTTEVATAVRELGNDVRYLTALDAEHHIFLGEWHAAFPQAQVIGPEGLPEKRAKQGNAVVPFAHVFKAASTDTVRVDTDFDADFDYAYVDVHPNKELVFNFKPEKTLIEADLMFNLPATEQYSRAGGNATSGFFTKLFAGFQSTAGSAIGQKRFLWYALSRGNRPRFNQSIHRIAKWDFDRIIPCHGDVVENNGKELFRKVFQWHLDAPPSKI